MALRNTRFDEPGLNRERPKIREAPPTARAKPPPAGPHSSPGVAWKCRARRPPGAPGRAPARTRPRYVNSGEVQAGRGLAAGASSLLDLHVTPKTCLRFQINFETHVTLHELLHCLKKNFFFPFGIRKPSCLGDKEQFRTGLSRSVLCPRKAGWAPPAPRNSPLPVPGGSGPPHGWLNPLEAGGRALVPDCKMAAAARPPPRPGSRL